jgi:hypothetical protein
MNNKRSSKNKSRSEDPLTKQVLEAAARKSIRRAAKETMEVMGYNVIARDGWVIKLFPDGSFEKISPIEKINQNPKLAYD